MTTSKVATIDHAAFGLVADIDRLAEAIQTATLDEAAGTNARMKMAREWAKLQTNAADLAERLVWLEACILRRIGELDPRVLSSAHRGAARHYATLTDEEMAKLLTDYPAKSATTAYNLWRRASDVRGHRTRGARSLEITGPSTLDEEEDETTLRYYANRHVTTVRQAAAILVSEYASLGNCTVSGIVDEFIDEEYPIRPGASPLEVTAFRRGLTDAVREAFTLAPVEATERSWEIPAFITTYDEVTDQWLRIPSEYARVGHAKQMLALRRGQVEASQRALTALESTLESRFGLSERGDGDYLRTDTTALSRRLAYADRQTVA